MHIDDADSQWDNISRRRLVGQGITKIYTYYFSFHSEPSHPHREMEMGSWYCPGRLLIRYFFLSFSLSSDAVQVLLTELMDLSVPTRAARPVAS